MCPWNQTRILGTGDRRSSLMVTRALLRTKKGIATRREDVTNVAPGHTTSSKDATMIPHELACATRFSSRRDASSPVLAGRCPFHSDHHLFLEKHLQKDCPKASIERSEFPLWIQNRQHQRLLGMGHTQLYSLMNMNHHVSVYDVRRVRLR